LTKHLKTSLFLLIFTVFCCLCGCNSNNTTTSADSNNMTENKNNTETTSISVTKEETASISTTNIDDKDTRILCYGDSLTVGTGGDGVTLCNTLEKLCGHEVLNYGVYAESLSCIAARQGANPQYLCYDIVVPADTTPVKAQVEGKYGYEMLLVFGDAGVNDVLLGDIPGTYSIDDEGNRFFTRLEAGDETPLPQGTQLITHAMLDKRDDDIMVLWGGSNDQPQTIEEIPAMLEKIDEMIEYHGNDKYIIVSLTSRHERIPVVDEVNKSYSEKYGEHYLDLRSYYVNDSLKDMGITPTDEDKVAMEIGDVPISLRYNNEEDPNHGNADFYRIAGEQIYAKLKDIGYIN